MYVSVYQWRRVDDWPHIAMLLYTTSGETQADSSAVRRQASTGSKVRVMPTELVLYISPWCGNSRAAQAALTEWRVPYRTIDIKEDMEAARRVRAWTGFESVPTIVIAEEGGLEPCQAPAPLPPGASPRGIDRGHILTEPSHQQLEAWLIKHGFLARP